MSTVSSSLVNPNTFPFTIANDNSVTSAGIYNSSNVLIKTLWSNIIYNSGTHSASWDGKDDLGNLQTIGTYTMKVVSNNITYTWEGTIGNNSDNQTGPTKHRYYGTIACMTEVGNYMYYGTAFSEADDGHWKLLKSAPLQKIRLFPNGTTSQQPLFNCANANNVFWAGRDYSRAGNFVIATAVSNDALTTFSSGVSYAGTAPVRAYPSVLDLNTLGGTGLATGMAVQQAGNQYLFVAHGTQNIINVYKTSGNTGNLVQTISITNPGSIFLENDTTLWISQGTAVVKYIVNSNGTITIANHQITGFSDIVSISIFNGDLCIADAGLSQQVVQRYNSTTLAYSTTLGQLGGYSTSPIIANDKFYMNDVRGSIGLSTGPTFVAHQSDGSIWVGDAGNYRYQHFDSSGNYLNNIMCLPALYNVNVCYNQNTAVFGKFLEYTIDYSQSLANGWILTNNWGYNQPFTVDPVSPVIDVILMSNSRRYMVVRATTNSYYTCELTSTGARYNTTTALPAVPKLDASGNLYTNGSSGTYPSQSVICQKHLLTGFNGSNDPIYGSAVTIATIPLGANSAYPAQGTFIETASGNIISFNQNNQTQGGGANKLFHLSGYSTTSSQLIWRACPETFLTYSGDFPQDGSFDIGNSVGGPGNECNIVGNNIFWGYRGENWKKLETGIIEHYNDQGLLLGIFGVLGPQTANLEATAGYHSNTLNVKPTQVGSDIYIYTNDESKHSGIHRWHISGLNTIATQNINFVLVNSTYLPTSTQTDLLAGLAENSIVSGSGWSQVPAVNFNTNSNNKFTTLTRNAQRDLSKSPDIVVVAGGGTNISYNLKRQLQSLSGLSNWTISGILDLSRLSFDSYTTNSTTNWSYCIQILDINSKVIAQILPVRTMQLVFNKAIFGPFGTSGVYGTSPFSISRKGSEVYINIFLFDQWLSTVQPIYDNTADISSPGSFEILFNFSTAQATNAQFGIVELFFQGS